jgi:hypothetical protein
MKANTEFGMRGWAKCSRRLRELLSVGYIRVHGAFAMLNSIAPLFIVDDLGATLTFYRWKLGFDVLYTDGSETETAMTTSLSWDATG